jgi:putative ABC transport system permease protein
VRRKLEAIDPNLKVDDVSRVADVVNQTLWKETAIANLSGFFGFLALVLAGLGLYGTVSYSVGLRTPEIGVRVALGARPGTIERLVLSEVAISVIAALCTGLPLGLVANRVLSSLIPGVLFGLSPGDPLAMCLAALFTIVVCVVAGYLPARKAARVDPTRALRHI